jgi:hypothetical protein
MTTFNPVTFLGNVKRIFAAATGLTTVATWSYPTLLSTEITYPAIFIELIGGEVEWYSTAKPNKLLHFYVRFVIFEDQTTSSASLGSYFSAILDAVNSNPQLLDSNSAATCEYFGAYEGRVISFDVASTEISGSMAKNAARIDVPCKVRDT